jgi:hypothetical protein
MYGQRYLFACKWFVFTELFFQRAKQIAISLHPFNLPLAGFSEADVSDLTTHLVSFPP